MNIPQTDFYLRIGGEWVTKTTKDLFVGKKTVVFLVPGAFTPTCTNQLPAFDKAYKSFTEKGVEQVICVSVNDAFVMNAWGKSLKVKNVKMIPDGNGTFTHGVKALVNKNNFGMSSRAWRVALILNKDGMVEWAGVEEGKRDLATDDPYSETTPENVLRALDLVEAAKAQAEAAEAASLAGSAA